MQLPKVPGNWVGVVARIDATTEEVKSFFDPISELIRNYSWEVSISYMFTRVEQAHNHLLRGAAVKIHSVNAPTANRFVDGQHITRKEFSRMTRMSSEEQCLHVPQNCCRKRKKFEIVLCTGSASRRKIKACLSGYHPHPLYIVCLFGLQARGRRRRIEEAIRLILDCSENRTGV